MLLVKRDKKRAKVNSPQLSPWPSHPGPLVLGLRCPQPPAQLPNTFSEKPKLTGKCMELLRHPQVLQLEYLAKLSAGLFQARLPLLYGQKASQRGS